MNELLTRLVVNTMGWIALARDDVLDPDTSVGLLESCAAELRRLTPQEQVELARIVAGMAAEADTYPRPDGGPRASAELRSFLHEFVDATGLEPDPLRHSDRGFPRTSA